MPYKIIPLEWNENTWGKYTSWLATTNHMFFTIKKHEDQTDYYVDCMYPGQTTTIAVKDTLERAKKAAEDHWQAHMKAGLEEC